MTVLYAQKQTYGRGGDQENGLNNKKPDELDCCTILMFAAHYFIHIIAHFCALNYLTVYILFKDAQENSEYMIDDVRGWTDINLILTCTMFYSIVNLQAIYLSCRYSRHILPCVVCAMFYGLC